MHCLYKMVSRRAVLPDALSVQGGQLYGSTTGCTVCIRWSVVGQYYRMHCLYKVVSHRAVLLGALSVQGGQL